ncbi:MAG: hypothetical protein HYZ42_18565, partial [Bacteroidetes bacterium]|nr:hypothetical protein [Bacteroidota bacterium]
MFLKKFEELITNKKSAKQSQFSFALKQSKLFLDMFMLPIKNHDWWEQAEELKQNCFYVDYHNEIISPTKIDAITYEKAHKVVNTIRKDVQEAIVFINGASEEELKEIKLIFKEAKIGDALHDSLNQKL